METRIITRRYQIVSIIEQQQLSVDSLVQRYLTKSTLQSLTEELTSAPFSDSFVGKLLMKCAKSVLSKPSCHSPITTTTQQQNNQNLRLVETK